MKFKFNNVFVTGANGWLGYQLVKTLLEGDEDVIDNFNNNNCRVTSFILNGDEKSKISSHNINHSIYEGDIRNIDDCKSFFKDTENSILFHLAGIIHPKNTSEFYDINYEGTKNVVESAILSGIKKIVVMSSNSPIGCNKDKFSPFNEESKYNPYMHYGKSKMMMEKYLIEKINKGVDITIIRSPWFYGDNMPKRQLIFYKMIQNGYVPVIGNGENLRSKAHIKNIIQGLLKTTFYEISKGKIYWIADEKPYSYNFIIDTTRKIMKEKFDLKTKKANIKLPFFFGQIAQLCDYVLQYLSFYNQKIHVLSELNKNIYCSIETAKKEIDFKPKINFESGMIKIITENINLFK
tara:strand:- start:8562 stop:9611 length:1050 start_codon:yes stop_codon:yes gene_type:complete